MKTPAAEQETEQELTTLQAIWLCGRWAKTANISLMDNPFKAPTYNMAWACGWRGWRGGREFASIDTSGYIKPDTEQKRVDDIWGKYKVGEISLTEVCKLFKQDL